MSKYDGMTRDELDKALKSGLSGTDAKSPNSRQGPGKQDLGAILHELEVHQIELEIQNRELRETREELEASRDRYASLYDFAPTGYVTLDRNGCIQQINLTGASMLGKERSWLLHKPLVAYVAKSDAGKFLEYLRRCVQDGEQSTAELGLKVKDGSCIQVQLVSVPIQDSDGTVYRTAMSDITSRKLAADELRRAHDELQTRVEERTRDLSRANNFLRGLIADHERSQDALRQSEEKFRAIFEAVNVGMCTCDADGRFTQANPAFREFIGYSEDELRKLATRDITHPEDLASTKRLFAEVVEGSRKIIDLETRYIRKDGQLLWGRVTAVFLRERDTKSIYSVSVIQDITPRKRLEQQIRQRNLELAAAVSSSLELSGVLGSLRRLLEEHMKIQAGGIFLYERDTDQFNLLSAWGLSAEILSKMELFPAGGLQDEWATPATDGIRSLELRDVGIEASESVGGKHEWKSYLRVPLVAKGETQGVAALMGLEGTESSEDLISFFRTLGQHVGVAIRNARLFEEARAGRSRLQTLSQRLVELQESERRGIARELHDQVGQLLTGLKLTLETAARLTPAQMRQALRRAQRIADEVSARVHDMSLDLRPTILDDLGLLPALLWHFEHYTSMSNIDVRFEQTGIERRFDPAVETAAYRIIQEALTNVARYSGAPEALVRVWSTDSLLCVVIEDRGAGFDSRSALESHSSSGLTGMRERATLLGGRLQIESSLGVGCRLTVELPLETQSDEQRTDQARFLDEQHNDSISR